MLLKQGRSIIVFLLGMLTFAIGYFLVSTFVFVERPTKDGIIEDWGRICFWSHAGSLYADVSPKGCYSTSCTFPKWKEGTAIVDIQARKIQLETRFALVKTSRFPLPCIDNCEGGGIVQFKFDPLIPNDYGVWFGDEKVGDLMIFSGRPTPRQCFDNIP
jgi:hypothetical protein